MLNNSGGNVAMWNHDNRSSLICAVREGRLERVSELISKYNMTTLSEGYNVLTEAVQSKHTMITKLLLSSGCPVNSEAKGSPLDTPLHFAVRNGNMEIVQMLLDKGANVDAKGYDDLTALQVAVDEEHLKIVEILLKHGAYVDTAHTTTKYRISRLAGYTPLCFAVDNSNEEIIRLLLNHGANIDVRSTNGWSPLHIAAKNEVLKIVELLLKHGANIDSTINLGSKRGYTPLGLAVEKENEEIIKLLLSHGADTNTTAKDVVWTFNYTFDKSDLRVFGNLLKNNYSGYTSECRNGYTPLHQAVEKGSEEIVKLLLSKGAKVDSKGGYGITPLHIAAKRGHLQIVKVLLKEGAYVDPVCRTIKYGGYTPLCLAVRNRHEKVVQLLLENGANVDSEDLHGNTILYYSVEKLRPVNLLIVQHLFTYGLDVNNQGNRNAYQTAICKSEKEVVEIFLQFDFFESEKSYDYRKMLHAARAAVVHGDLRTVEQLLSKQEEIVELSKTHVVDANARDATEKTSIVYITNPELLALAVKEEQKEIVELLLRYGADTNAIDKHGRTALHFTSINENVNGLEIVKTGDVMGDIAKLLLSWGADVNARDGTFTTLHIAVENQYVKVVEALLEHNADVNSASELGITPLHICAKTGNKEITKMLLNKGANVNAKQHNGMTALHLATDKGRKEVVEVLLRCGANVDFGHGLDLMPLHIAVFRRFLDIVEILLKFDADIDVRDGFGRTPLHFACRDGHIPMIVALLQHGSDINIESYKKRFPIDYAIQFNNCDSDDDFVTNHDYHRHAIDIIFQHHMFKLKTANLYVNEENLIRNNYVPDNEINDLQYECNEEIARMKSEKINNANVSFFDILTKGRNRIALYAENEDVVEVFKSEDYKINFPMYGDMIENNFRKGKRRNALLKEGNKTFNFLFNNFHELPYTCKSKIFSYLSDNDLKIFTHTTFE